MQCRKLDMNIIDALFFKMNNGKPMFKEVKSHEREKVKCPKCNVEVWDGNFCEHCGAKLKEVCNCWVLKRKYNCSSDTCKGYKLFKEIKMV